MSEISRAEAAYREAAVTLLDLLDLHELAIEDAEDAYCQHCDDTYPCDTVQIILDHHPNLTNPSTSDPDGR